MSLLALPADVLRLVAARLHALDCRVLQHTCKRLQSTLVQRGATQKRTPPLCRHAAYLFACFYGSTTQLEWLARCRVPLLDDGWSCGCAFEAFLSDALAYAYMNTCTYMQTGVLTPALLCTHSNILALLAGAGVNSDRATLETLRWLDANQMSLEYAGVSLAERGQLAPMHWWLARYERHRTNLRWSRGAARNGHAHILEYLESNYPRDAQHAAHYWVAQAARGGQHALVQRLAARYEIAYDERICAKAARGGHLALLRWLLHDQQCLTRCTDGLLPVAAARGGHLHVLQYLLIECALPLWRPPIFAAAVYSGDCALIDWLAERYPAVTLHPAIMAPAGCSRHYAAVLERLLRRGAQPYLHTFTQVAARNDRYWCERLWNLGRANSHRLTEALDAMRIGASRGGHLDLLRWLDTLVDADSADARYDATYYARREMLVSAATRGHLSVLRYVLDALPAPLEPDQILDLYGTAISEGRLNVLRWLRNEYAWPSVLQAAALCRVAIVYDQHATLCWLIHEFGVPMQPDLCAEALELHRWHMLLMLLCSGVPCTRVTRIVLRSYTIASLDDALFVALDVFT